MSNWYDGVGDAKVTKRGSYMKPGKYLVKILAVKEVKGQRGGEFFIVEMKVLESNNPEISVGSEKAWVVKMDNLMALPNIKGFVSAASGVDPLVDNAKDLVEAFWTKIHPAGEHMSFSRIVSEMVVQANALEGVDMGLECVNTTTQEGNPFTVHNWEVRQG
jgi:hypothetical protein